MAIKRGFAHGLYKVVIQIVGANGASYGQAGDTISSGTTSQSYVSHYPKSASLAIPDSTTIDFTGGDVWVSSYTYGINSLGSFEFTVQDVDADLVALVSSSTVDATTNAAWNTFTEDVLATAFVDCSLMFIYRMQSVETATFGQTYYLNSIVPRATLKFKGGQQAFQSAEEITFQVSPKANARLINGLAVPAAMGATDNKLVYYHIISDNPLYMFVHKANGTSVSATSGYLPVTSTVGTSSNTKNMIVKNASSTYTAGVADTVSTSTGVFAVGTALTVASGNELFFLHETNYTPSS